MRRYLNFFFPFLTKLIPFSLLGLKTYVSLAAEGLNPNKVLHCITKVKIDRLKPITSGNVFPLLRLTDRQFGLYHMIELSRNMNDIRYFVEYAIIVIVSLYFHISSYFYGYSTIRAIELTSKSE